MAQEATTCRVCGRKTELKDAELCNNCWELQSRISIDPVSAEKLLNEYKESRK